MAEAEAGRLNLYSHWRSSCSHRARIALNLKGVDYEYKAVDVLNGEQSDPEFVKLNPMKFVPALVDGDSAIGDSYAIALYLEDKYPEPPLLPHDLQKKALNHQIASIVGSGIQPFQNLTVVRFLDQKIGAGESALWTKQQIERGFTAIESLIQLKGCVGKYATGDEVQLADVFLAPQIYVAIELFKIDMSNYPTLARLHSEQPGLSDLLKASQTVTVAVTCGLVFAIRLQMEGRDRSLQCPVNSVLVTVKTDGAFCYSESS